MKMFFVLLVLTVSACAQSTPPPKTLCVHPFVNGGSPTVLPDDHMAYRDGRIVLHDDGKEVTLRGALCITVTESK